MTYIKIQKNHDISQNFDFLTIYSDISEIYRDISRYIAIYHDISPDISIYCLSGQNASDTGAFCSEEGNHGF